MSTPASLPIGSGDAIGAELPNQTGYTGERPARRPKAPAVEADAGRGQRLEIRQDPQTGEWIYIVTDRDTGAVIARLSREEVARLGRKVGYEAGALVKAKA